MRRLALGEREIGEGCPCLVVAELGVNHQGDPEIALRLIDVAAAMGAGAVKLQRRDIDAILTRQAQDAPYRNDRSFGRTYGDHRRALELPDEAWPLLKARADAKGLLFFATPYDPGSAEFLGDLGVPCVKIASCDVTNPPLLEAAATLGVPVLLSTGMATEEEIDRAVRLVWRQTQDLVLMHCVSAYPAENGDLNLRYMLKLAKRYAAIPGYSGHERGLATSVAAVVLGAAVVERHVTLDRSMRGPDHSASLEPEGLRRLVRDIRNVEAALVSHPKRILPGERLVRDRLAKSLVTAHPLEAGQVLERSMLTVKGPGTGLSPWALGDLLGRRVTRAVPGDVLLAEEMLAP